MKYGTSFFCSKKGEVESFQLPPCAATLYRHCLRANYQARIWKLSLQGSPPVPSPAGKGWLVESVDDKNQLMIDWSDVAAAPDAVLPFLACKCSRSCNEQTCPCIANGMFCTELCKLQTCSNQAQDDPLLTFAEDSSSDDEEDEEWE